MASTMMTTWILVAAGILALVVLLYMAVRTRTDQIGLDSAISIIRSIDVEAFRNLVDPAEVEFLRRNLTPGEFRRIKRERARAALAYVRSAGKAAVLFAKAGQAAQRSADPEVAKSGTQIANSALQLRLYTVQASLRLATEVALPAAMNAWHPPLIDKYERAAETLLRLGRLEREQRG